MMDSELGQANEEHDANAEMKNWEITCGPENFERMRRSDEFIGMVRLGRICNAIRTVHVMIAEAKDDGTPGYTRKLINAFLLMGAIVHEGIKSIRDNQGAYRDLETYRKMQRELLKGGRYNEVKNYIRIIRNKIAFHCDKEMFEEGLLKYKRDKYIFGGGQGAEGRNFSYSMADNLCLCYLLDLGWEKMPPEEDIGRVVTQLVQYGIEFAQGADSMIFEGLTRMGWEPEESD